MSRVLPLITTIKYILILIPIFIYFFILHSYALNYPVADDYNAIIQFLCEYRSADMQHKVILLFSQHNEHRILFSRIIYVLYDILPGGINLRAIIYIGNLQLVISFAFFLYFIRKLFPTSWFWPAFVSSLSFFDLSNWEIAYSPMGSVANYSVLMLFFISAFFYSSSAKHMLLPAVFFHFVTFFSLGNGVIASIALVLFNLFDRQRQKAIVSGCVTGISAVFYFFKFSLMGSATLELSVSKTILFFLRYMSGHFVFFDNASWLPVFAGSGIILAVLLLLPIRKIRFEKHTSFFVVTLMCCLGSALLTSVFRSAISPLPAYRYLIYAHVIFAVLAIFVWIRIGDRKFGTAHFTLIYLLIVNYLANVHVGVVNYDATRRWILSAQVQHPDVDGAKKEVDRACRLGIYCWPPMHGK